jgi:hypothetical protein
MITHREMLTVAGADFAQAGAASTQLGKIYFT